MGSQELLVSIELEGREPSGKVSVVDESWLVLQVPWAPSGPQLPSPELNGHFGTIQVGPFPCLKLSVPSFTPNPSDGPALQPPSNALSAFPWVSRLFP